MNAWQRARRLLCVRLDGMGDLLMTTPAIRALRGSTSERTITLLTSEAGAEAAALVSEIDCCWTYTAPWMKTSVSGIPERDWRIIRRLSDGRFDAAVIFTVYTQSPLPAALFCRLAGIPLRLAYCRENPYRLLTDWVPEREPESLLRHEVRRQLDLVASIGARTDDEGLSLTVPDSAARRVRNLLAEKGFARRRPWIMLHPGASAPSRRYPASAFAQVVSELSGMGIGSVITGSQGELVLIEEVMAAIRPTRGAVISLGARLRFDEMAALTAMASLVITNNTGPAHIAAAVGTPTVVLYALTNPQHTPWKAPARILFQDVPCRFCYKSVCPEGHQRCLTLVTPGAVVRAAMDLLDRRGIVTRAPKREVLAT